MRYSSVYTDFHNGCRLPGCQVASGIEDGGNQKDGGDKEKFVSGLLFHSVTPEFVLLNFNF